MYAQATVKFCDYFNPFLNKNEIQQFGLGALPVRSIRSNIRNQITYLQFGFAAAAA